MAILKISFLLTIHDKMDCSFYYVYEKNIEMYFLFQKDLCQKIVLELLVRYAEGVFHLPFSFV